MIRGVILQPELETMAPDERSQLQLRRLRALVARLRASGSPYWSERLRSVEAVDDVTSLP
ncbi:MAG: hypothetical protein H0T39_11770, partial [Actinobacteria bacterium]|nr:hypothetical protein [Actinomycetota bacterium]